MKPFSLAGLFGFALLLSGCGDEPQPAPPRPVLTVTVKTLKNDDLGRFAGSIQARYESVLGFRTNGRIASRLFDVGDFVGKGALLATLDPTDQQNQLRASQGDLASAEAQLIDAQANARRQEELFARSVTAQARLDDARTRLKTSQASFDQAKAAVQQARDQLSYTRLVTDFDGVITTWHAEAGQVVSAGQAVVTLARPEVREAVFDLPTEVAESLPADARFLVSAQLDPQARTTGSIRELGPQADASTRTRRVRLSLAQTPEAFRLGSTIQVQLSSAGSMRSVLPASVLLERDGKTQVWVVDGKQSSVALREVQVLSRDERQVVIGQGLATATGWSAPESTASSPARRSNSTRMRDEGRFQPVGLGPAPPVPGLVPDGGIAGDGRVLLPQPGARGGSLVRHQDHGHPDPLAGRTVDDTLEQVTDRIEKKLEELDSLDYVKSYTRPGESTVFVYLKDTTKAGDIPDIWYQVRKKISDIQGEFPQGIQGPGFNDEFGDVFGSVYAFTADGLDFRQLRDYVEKVRLDIRSVKDLGKVQMIGAQNEVIYLNFSTRKLAALGLDQRQVVQSLQAQNAVTPSGVVEAGPERISVRTSGNFRSEKDLQAVNLRVNDRFYRLSDLASISRDFVDPPTSLFRYKGEPAIGLAVAMKEGGNILEFGEALNARMQEITGELPVGVGVHQVSNQAQVVKKAVGGFTRALFEAVVIVLIVSFVSLGLRAGLVVACSIPLVLAMVFVFMEYTDITMQRVSLGALIIALGLLVDDAMITVEMMITRLELGDSLHDSATYAYTSTAFPMLTGTLVTVAGFVPIGLNASSAGEYTFTLFAVIAVALLLSWIVAVLFAPVIAVHILPKTLKHKSEQKKGRIAERFDSLLHLAMRRRWTTIFLTALLFGVSLFLMKFVQHQFFPSSDRPELLVDLNLPQNSSIHETRAVMDRLEATLKDDEDIDHWSAYVGEGAIRFYLPLDQQLQNNFYGQLVIVTKDLEARERVAARLRDRLRKDYVGISTYVQPLEMGPPVGRPIQYRVSGPQIDKVREYAMGLAGVLDGNPNIGDIVYDWNEPGKMLKIDIAQDKARQLGLSSEDVAQIMNSVVTGSAVTQVRDDIYLVNVIGRAEDSERGSLETLESLQIVTPSGTSIPLKAFAKVSYELEQPLVWRRDRKPTITVKASLRGEIQPTDLVARLAPEVKRFADGLPANYRIEVGGTVEESGKAEGPIAKVVPLMLFLMATFLMIQLQSVQKLFLVASVAPLGLIGVVAALLPTGTPMGFVAILGILALIGIIIRNSVILVTQIDASRRTARRPGRPCWKPPTTAPGRSC